MTIRPRISLALHAFSLMLLSGCRPPVPDVSGQWHGMANLPNTQRDKTAADVTLVLSQTDRSVHGDAVLYMDHSKTAVHVPINTAALTLAGSL